MRRLDRSYKIPEGLSVHGSWRAFSIDQRPMVAVRRKIDGLQVWDLSSGSMVLKTDHTSSISYPVHPQLRVLVCSPYAQLQ